MTATDIARPYSECARIDNLEAGAPSWQAMRAGLVDADPMVVAGIILVVVVGAIIFVVRRVRARKRGE